MRKEFESDLARSVAEKGQKKVRGKAWLVMALGAALLVSGFAAVTAVSAGDFVKEKDQLKLQDGSCEEDPDDCVPINDGDDCVPINDGDDCVPINDGDDCVPINDGDDCVPINDGDDCVPIEEGDGIPDCITP